MVVDDSLYSTLSRKQWKRIGIKKRSGILIPLFSVHSEKSTGIGDFFDLKILIDLCVKINHSILQLLPLNYAGSDNCPYNAISSFAIDPVFISVSDFNYKGKSFSKETIKNLQNHFVAGKNNRCNYEVREVKLELLREMFDTLFDEISSDREFFDFVNRTRYWLDEFSVYLILKKIHNSAAWYHWENDFREINFEKIKKILSSYKKDILFNKWTQFICYSQLCEAKRYATKNNVLVMGDLPVLPSRDSADVWAKRNFFNLELVAGAPPDMYCVYGQRWGMPIHNNENLRLSNFEYVIEKLKYLDNFFDIVRIDHVVGLFRIWAIDVNEPEENQGLNGRFIPEDQTIWKENGKEILSAMVSGCNSLLCAEDLGVIPDVCPQTLKELGIPGYEVQRWKKNYGSDFSFVSKENYRELSISSLSTHDTSFWFYWWKNEAGTVEKELFKMKSKQFNLNTEFFIKQLFEKDVIPDRLKWKKEIDSVEKLIQTLGKPIDDIIHLYKDTFDEKEKLKKVLGIFDYDDDTQSLKKALDFVYKSASIFCINLLTDIACLDRNIASQIGHLRINKPGTRDEKNWRFAFEQTLEQLTEQFWVKEITGLTR